LFFFARAWLGFAFDVEPWAPKILAPEPDNPLAGMFSS